MRRKRETWHCLMARRPPLVEMFLWSWLTTTRVGDVIALELFQAAHEANFIKIASRKTRAKMKIIKTYDRIRVVVARKIESLTKKIENEEENTTNGFARSAWAAWSRRSATVPRRSVTNHPKHRLSITNFLLWVLFVYYVLIFIEHRRLTLQQFRESQ